MIWDDTGFLISKNRYNENSLIAEVFTKDHGKVSGIIFGGTSKKIKNYLQIGNKIYINYNSKSDTRIGYFKIEIQEALSPYFFDSLLSTLPIPLISRRSLPFVTFLFMLFKCLSEISITNQFRAICEYFS